MPIGLDGPSCRRRSASTINGPIKALFRFGPTQMIWPMRALFDLHSGVLENNAGDMLHGEQEAPCHYRHANRHLELEGGRHCPGKARGGAGAWTFVDNPIGSRGLHGICLLTPTKIPLIPIWKIQLNIMVNPN
jgi:hypothetical protein